MYLNSHTILQNCGYDLTTVPIYVSCEHAKTKRTGNLFKKVLEDLEFVSPDEVLHIGDNLRSDWFRPKLIGMKAILVKSSDVRKK